MTLFNTIKRVGVIDDYEDGRNTLAYTVEDANLEPIFQKDSVSDLNTYLSSINKVFDAIVTDHHLRKVRSYFPIDGAEFAAHCYSINIPSLLVTRYEHSEILEIRKFKERLPVVLTPEEYNVDSLIEGFNKCINEFKGNLSIDRKSWRTLIRIDDIKEDRKCVYIIIPGWNSQRVIPLDMDSLPEHIKKAIKPDMRFFAKVNIGTEHPHELYIKEWE